MKNKHQQQTKNIHLIKAKKKARRTTRISATVAALEGNQGPNECRQF